MLFPRSTPRYLCTTVLCGLLSACSAVSAESRVVLVFGDSLSCGYRIPKARSWPTLLQNRLSEKALPYLVVNASRRGETTKGGLRRINQAIENVRPDVVILELGANDALRGIPFDKTVNNLRQILAAISKHGAVAVVVGMRLPPTHSNFDNEAFGGMFRDLAQQYNSAYVPFLLAGLIDRPNLFLPDRLHPNSEAQPILLDTVWPALSAAAKSMEHPEREDGLTVRRTRW